jgi:two-component system response regulator NreC
MQARILIADDHGVLRSGLRALIEGTAEMLVIAEATDGEEALRLAGDLRPDVLLLDISMPALDGIEVTRRVRHTLPETHVLILTMHEDTAMLREALRAGAAGYIIKRAVGSELLNAIRAVCHGELYIHSLLARDLFQDSFPARPRNCAVELLSAREVEVLRLIAEGYTNRQIAEALILSVRTIESHRASIMDKLGMHSRAELAKYAGELGILQPYR